MNQQAASFQPSLRPQFSDDTAALRIKIPNYFVPSGPRVLEVRLRATVECQQQRYPYPSGTCWARVDVLSAPKGKLDELVSYFDSNSLPRGGLTQEYGQMVSAQMKRKYDEASRQLREQAEAAARASRAQFEQAMDALRTNGAEGKTSSTLYCHL